MRALRVAEEDGYIAGSYTPSLRVRGYILVAGLGRILYVGKVRVAIHLNSNTEILSVLALSATAARKHW